MDGVGGQHLGADATRSAMVRVGMTNIVEWMPVRARGDVLSADRVHLHLVVAGALMHDEIANPGGLQEGWAFFTRGAELGMRPSAECRLITVSVPPEVFPGSNALGPAALQTVKPDSALLPPVRAFVTVARKTDATELSGVGRYYLERLLQEMVLALTVEVDRLVGIPRAVDTFSRALMIITAQCGDPGLTAASIARDLSLSLRQLERVFSERQTTIGTEVRRARVEHAVALLRNREYDGLSVDQIAAYSGFSNGSSLARAMRAAGHPSPSSMR